MHVLTTRRPGPVVAASLVAMALAATSIGALLGDLYGVASMSTLFWAMTVPGLLALAALAVVPVAGLEPVQQRIRIGAIGGVAGIIGYDVVRIPLVLIGQRVLAPIDSYGLMINGGHMASPWSNTFGWLFHLSNGVTFGVIYAVVAARRHWGWGVLWGVALETTVVFSPFLERYGLAGKYGTIALAYSAHVAFGYPLGLVVQHFDRVQEELRSVFRRPATVIVGLAVMAIVVWHHPWSQSAARREATAASTRTGWPSVVVERDRFTPEWVRVNPGGCLHVVNHSTSTFTTSYGTVPAAGEGDLCFTGPGRTVKRVKLGPEDYSGGFVLISGPPAHQIFDL